jgi:prepilin-type N-terminal cleavage/methylation domain-containing protein
MKQRKGFTLIELMIVIAIIIILAAIAIPNYLRMTDRARRSRVAGDFASTATALEAYMVDWGAYPLTTVPGTAEQFGKVHLTTRIYYEIIGHKTLATLNKSGNTTLTGEDGGIEYIKAGTLASMYNPFIPTSAAATDLDYYYKSDTTGSKWALYVYLKAGVDNVLCRTDSTTDLKEGTVAVVVTAYIP